MESTAPKKPSSRSKKYNDDTPSKMVFKVKKKVQECKESKIEMYKSIWGLVFKCNGSER
jgi:hypothetical protein